MIAMNENISLLSNDECQLIMECLDGDVC
jgi:hypothetical protein